MMMHRSFAGSTGTSTGMGATFADEGRLLRAVKHYLDADDVAHVQQVLAFARELRAALYATPSAAAARPNKASGRETGGMPTAVEGQAPEWDVDYVIGVAQTLAESVHIDVISLAAVLLYQTVESDLVTLEDVRQRLGGAFGEAVAQTIENIERFDTLERPRAALRRTAQTGAEDEVQSRERRRSRERQQRQGAESLRKMFVAMTEDPRVAVFKIADQLRQMRLARQAADARRAVDAGAAPVVAERTADGQARPALSEAECRTLAQETREIFAPLAGRLGMGRVEGELEDLAFAILEPDEYRWLSDAVRVYTQQRGQYVARVCDILRTEMRKIGLHADVSGRVKHLYSIYKKVERTGSHDLSTLYDVLAFRVIVETVADCYLALGHVHELWRPKDGRIKDFIANPKPNGYQSLHTTVFCLDDRLAEIQIRTRQMHELAEYGVAMHWYYKSAGDAASAQANSLQSWVRQLKEWQVELQEPGPGGTERVLNAVKGDVLKEQIFVFTPAGDVKELPAGSTPIDFAYLVHTDVGNHVAGARVSSQDANGRLVKKLVPLDYELKNGDVIEIIKRKDAHPTRDWLNVARTKSARDRIQKYLKAHERDIDLQMGRERLDRDLRAMGLRKGYEDLSDDDIEWLTQTFEQRDIETLLVSIGAEKLKASVVIAKLREHLFPPVSEPEAVEVVTSPARETDPGASVAGLEGMLTRLAGCCDPLPGDALMGFITRGKGVVIHRADCPNLAHLLAQEPGRGIAVSLPKMDGQHNFRAPIVIEALDRTGLLADVTGVITGLKINMLKVNTATYPKQHRAIITATLEIQRPEQLAKALSELQQVPSVLSVERKRTAHRDAAAGRARAATSKQKG
jgi:GTP pyrophosphokinase